MLRGSLRSHLRMRVNSTLTLRRPASPGLEGAVQPNFFK